MKEININELKKIQIEILNNIDEFCKKKNINYWLDYGTLIGAVRHSGYIPWDDDIDIGMLRDDYNKFLKEYNDYSDRYKIFDCEKNSNYYFPHGKVIDTKTVLYEPDENGTKIGVYIDVFPHDKASDDDNENRKTYEKKELFDKLRYAKLYPNSYDKKNIKKRILRTFLNIYLYFLPKNYYAKKTVKNAKRFLKKNTNKIADFFAPYRAVVDKEVFEKFIKMKFEKKEYSVPSQYDKYLRVIYGDYMKLPPKEKRVSNHNFVAYYKEDDK